MTTALTPTTSSTITIADHTFDQLAALTLQTVSKSSARIYGQTYALWSAWCADYGISPAVYTPANVLAFIGSQNASKATQQRQLSAMRTLARMAYVLTGNDNDRRTFEALKIVKFKGDSASGTRRTKVALGASQADKVLRVWSDDTPLALRNAALVAVLALTGMRRAECAALRWSDIDFENGVIHIWHGKGDKERAAPIAGDYALDALRRWQMHVPADRQYIFCYVTKGGKLGADKPLSGTAVYNVMKATGVQAGVDFKPHDLRRTFITEALSTGTPIHTVQNAVGHVSGTTTLRYAQSVNARDARKQLKLRYGD